MLANKPSCACDLRKSGQVWTGVHKPNVSELPHRVKLMRAQLWGFKSAGGLDHYAHVLHQHKLNHPGSDGGSVLSGGWRNDPIFEVPCGCRTGRPRR